MHIGGQELPMHDSRFEPAMGVIYKADATPGRHIQASQYCPPEGLNSGMPEFGAKRHEQVGRGRYIKPLACLTHVVNSSGFCLFGFLSTRVEALPEWLTAVTGHPYDLNGVIECGERIANIRQAFNVREGYNLVADDIPERAYGIPPLQAGPLKDLTVQIEMLLHEHLEEMGWTLDAAVPRPEVLARLGLGDVAQDLWK
jgi:aldehyde:ferredoxin oxidoreductase